MVAPFAFADILAAFRRCGAKLPRGKEPLTAGISRRPADAPYSTVTDFARLRGWSTSVPMMTAV